MKQVCLLTYFCIHKTNHYLGARPTHSDHNCVPVFIKRNGREIEAMSLLPKCFLIRQLLELRLVLELELIVKKYQLFNFVFAI